MRLNTCRPVLLLSLCLIGSAAGQEYEIKITRPVQAGLKYRVSVSGSNQQRQVVTVNGQFAEKTESAFSAALEADVVVTAVNEKGQPTHFEYTVRKLTRTDGDKTTELLPAGKLIAVDRTRKDAPPFSLKDGGALEPPALEALDVVITEGKKNASDEDLIFGTRERKAAGAEWPIHAEMAAADLLAHGVQVAKEDVAGTGRMNGVERVNDMECLSLTMTIEARNVKLAMPPEFTVEKGSFKASATGLFPTDTTQPKQAFSARMQLSAVAKGGIPGQAVVVEIQVERSGNEKRTYAP